MGRGQAKWLGETRRSLRTPRIRAESTQSDLKLNRRRRRPCGPVCPVFRKMTASAHYQDAPEFVILLLMGASTDWPSCLPLRAGPPAWRPLPPWASRNGIVLDEQIRHIALSEVDGVDLDGILIEGFGAQFILRHRSVIVRLVNQVGKYPRREGPQVHQEARN
jgi:hypothetical protein